MTPLHVAFVGGPSGSWVIDRLAAVSGAGLAPASHLDMIEGRVQDLATHSIAWCSVRHSRVRINASKGHA